MNAKKEKIDRRILYTKMILQQSLLDLMKSKHIHRITMTELCERAEVNPKTFYTHYKNVEDLLNCIEEDFLQKIRESIYSHGRPDSVKSLLAAEYRVFQANAEVCGTFFAEHNFPRFSQKLAALVHDPCIQYWKSLGISDQEDRLELLFAFYADGGLAVLREWLLNTPNEDIDQLAELIERMTIRGLSGFFSHEKQLF